MICPQCGTPNNPGDKFCEQCGAVLQAPAEDGAAATQVGAPPEAATLVRRDEPGQSYALGNRAIVGRLDTCDVPIHDKSVSREHARLSQLPGGYVLEDLGSTNGTFVNGSRIQEAVVVRPGDEITFGSIEFSLEGEAAAQPAAPGPEASTQAFQYQPQTEPEPAPWSQPMQTAQPEPAQAPPAFDFPPLQPFTATPEPSSNDESASTQSGTSIPFRDTSQSQSGGSVPVHPPSSTESAQATPQPQAPSDDNQSASSPPETLAGAPPVASQSVPTRTQAWGNLSDEVVAAAAHLSDLVGALAQQLSSAEARLQEAQQTSGNIDAVRQALQSAPRQTIQSAQLQSLQGSLDQLVQQPRDIEVLMQVGRQAPDLAAVVREYDQLRQVLDNLASAAG
jgi:hypothetical protein